MKRFYRRAAPEAGEGGYRVLLDGRPLRTPAGRSLLLPEAGLAAAIAEEWQAQGERVEPSLMPFTRLATTTIDRMPARRKDILAELAGFARTDLLCYRAAHPEALADRQRRDWQPWLDWASREFGAGLETTTALEPVAQPEEAVAQLVARCEALDDWRLVGLHAVTRLTGSLVLGLAVERGELDAERAFALSHLEELWEMERWGRDAEQERRLAGIRRELEAACRYLALLPGRDGRRPG
ncbi:MAG TPA: ATPase [Rhodospirillales bacterium]|nr:ATPase [Rhodospirillales bacterium]